jgi:hypothetical protein
MDLFGLPSAEEAAMGVPLHGEAAVQQWSFEPTAKGCIGRVDLPVAQLKFQRTLSLADSSSVLFVEEQIANKSTENREIHWVQHLSLGPPFLVPGQSSIHASLDHAISWPRGYDRQSLMPDHMSLEWPQAPSRTREMLDLRIPFQCPGTGFVAAARVDTTRKFAYIVVLNWQLGLALTYVFPREDFPWVAIWEENCARDAAPWNGTAQVRGMEFGTTPLSIGREAISNLGTLFDTPVSWILPGNGILRTRYAACIIAIPPEWREITDVIFEDDTLTLIGSRSCERISIRAEDFVNSKFGELIALGDERGYISGLSHDGYVFRSQPIHIFCRDDGTVFSNRRMSLKGWERSW